MTRGVNQRRSSLRWGISAVISQGPGSEPSVTSRLEPVSAPTQWVSERLLLSVISIASGQATTDLHPDTRDGPDFADPELLLNDKTSDHLKKSSLGTNFTP